MTKEKIQRNERLNDLIGQREGTFILWDELYEIQTDKTDKEEE